MSPELNLFLSNNFPEKIIQTIAAVLPISTAELCRLGEHEMKQLAKLRAGI